MTRDQRIIRAQREMFLETCPEKGIYRPIAISRQFFEDFLKEYIDMRNLVAAYREKYGDFS